MVQVAREASQRHGQIVEWDSGMTSIGVPVPALDPAWPADLAIVVVTSDASPYGWRNLAHQMARVAQPGGHSFPLASDTPGSRRGNPGRKAYLYRQVGHVCGYLALSDKTVTGYRDLTAGYRQADAAERGQQAVRPGGVGGAGNAASWRGPAVGGRGSGGLRDHLI